MYYQNFSLERFCFFVFCLYGTKQIKVRITNSTQLVENHQVDQGRRHLFRGLASKKIIYKNIFLLVYFMLKIFLHTLTKILHTLIID